MRSFTLFFSLLISSQAFSFINIESLRQSTDLGYAGSVGLRASGEIGNTSNFKGNFSTLDGHISEKRELILLADYNYGESLSVRNQNSGRLHLRHTRLYQSSPDIETFAQVQFNEFTRIKHRSLVGANLRFRIYKEENHFLYLGTGLFYEKQERDEADNKDGIRANLYFSYLFKKEDRYEATLTAYFQPYVDRPSDIWINGVSGASYFLTKALTFDLQLSFSHDSRPVKGIKTTDITYYTGLSFRY